MKPEFNLEKTDDNDLSKSDNPQTPETNESDVSNFDESDPSTPDSSVESTPEEVPSTPDASVELTPEEAPSTPQSVVPFATMLALSSPPKRASTRQNNKAFQEREIASSCKAKGLNGFSSDDSSDESFASFNKNFIYAPDPVAKISDQKARWLKAKANPQSNRNLEDDNTPEKRPMKKRKLDFNVKKSKSRRTFGRVTCGMSEQVQNKRPGGSDSDDDHSPRQEDFFKAFTAI